MLPAEVEHGLPGILKSVPPSARPAVIGLAPAELIDESPAPLPLVRDDEVRHIQIALPVVDVFLDVKEVGAIGCQDRLDSGRDRAEPLDRPFFFASVARGVVQSCNAPEFSARKYL